MLPTPSTSHVSFDRVYEPAEDSFLLLDTLSSEAEVDFLRNRFPGADTAPLVVEVGTGSGVVLAFVTANAQSLFGHSNVCGLGLDVNKFACKATAETVHTALHDVKGSAALASSSSPVFLDSVLSDLTTSLRPASVDILIFNPPYVPTEELPDVSKYVLYEKSDLNRSEEFDRDSYLLSLSYAGGADGMETTTRLLSELPTVLDPERGVAYILLCAQNKPEEVKQLLRSWGTDWITDTIASSGKTGGWEKLQIVRVCRKNNKNNGA